MGLALENVRVLVVEDEFLIADDLRDTLQKAGARTVGPVGTVSQARELIEAGRFDAAVLDLNLHGEMATDLVDELVQRRVPFLIVSGYGADALPPLIANHARLEKPAPPAQVVEALTEVLRCAPAS